MLIKHKLKLNDFLLDVKLKKKVNLILTLVLQCEVFLLKGLYEIKIRICLLMMKSIF